MARDFEEELRRTLRDRAGDVAPDPAMFARVQSRIRRGRTIRLALAGVAGAFAVTGVALAAPALMDRRVEFRPPAVAEAPASPSEIAPNNAPTPTPTPAPVTDLAPYVYSTGDGVLLSGGGSVLGHTAGVQSVAAQPGSTVADVRVAVAEGRTCRVIRYGSRRPQDGGPAPAPGRDVSPQSGCGSTPVFSPDGASLAWLTATGEAWGVHTVDVDESGPGTNEASFGLPWPADQPVDLQEWVWTEQSATEARGYLVLRTRRQGAWMLLQMPIERQADGALAMGLEPVPVVSEAGLTPVAFASSGVAAEGGGGGETSYTMEILQAPDGIEGGRVIRRVGSEGGGVINLPPELFESTPFAVTDLWMSASGDHLLYGNAQQRMAWSVDWSAARPAPSNLNVGGELLRVVHADLLVSATQAAPEGPPPDHADTSTPVDVFFGMKGADACVADQRVRRLVDGPGVARGALHALFAGPTSRESNEGIESPFYANTADALNDIEIVDGQARVDLRDFSDDVGTDSCTKSAILDSLDKTLLQFPTVTSTRYSFGGSVEAWEAWLGSDTEHPAVPPVVADKAAQILDAARSRDYGALERLSRGTSCSLSDQPEPCAPLWKDQEGNGEDPLGLLAETMQTGPARAPDTDIWIWPAEAFGGNYSGPRVGIDADGRWLYFVQEGG